MGRRSEGQEESELALLSNDDSTSSSEIDDLEANTKVEQTSKDAEPEYQTPTTLKAIWLTAYFGLSMALTIYNKLILGSVRRDSKASSLLLLTMLTVQSSMAPNLPPHNCLGTRDTRHVENGVLQALKTQFEGAYYSGCIFCALHIEHRYVKSIIV